MWTWKPYQSLHQYSHTEIISGLPLWCNYMQQLLSQGRQIRCLSVSKAKRKTRFLLSFCCRCKRGVFRIWCGGVPCFPDVANHRGTDTGVFREGQNWGAALSAGPVSHATSSQARMQRQTASGEQSWCTPKCLSVCSSQVGYFQTPATPRTFIK